MGVRTRGLDIKTDAAQFRADPPAAPKRRQCRLVDSHYIVTAAGRQDLTVAPGNAGPDRVAIRRRME